MSFEFPGLRENDSSDSSWYAIYTRHQHEKMVAQNLSNKGFNIFLPLYTDTHNWKDRTKIVSLPLFPSYVFIRGGLERRLQIMTTPGIHGLVSCGAQPAAIPVAEIEAIERVVKSGARLDAHPYLKCGDVVRIKYGPLEGIQGILVRKKNISRLVLSVEMLGKSAAMEINASQIEPVNTSLSTEFNIEHGTVSRHTRGSEAHAAG